MTSFITRIRASGARIGFLSILAFGLATVSPARAADDYLDVDQAFQLSAQRRADGGVALNWQIADGYTLYRQRLHLRVDGAEIAALWPTPDRKPDPAGGDVVEVYHHRLTVDAAVPAGTKRIEIEYQGCADAGLCYPPQTRSARLDADPSPPGSAAMTPLALVDDVADGAAASSASATRSDAVAPGGAAAGAATDLSVAALPTADAGAQDSAGRVLRSGNLAQVIATFLVFGLLLSLTPCVLPMVPILSAIIVGQGVKTRRRGLQLAAAYALGMALVYTALGIAAGLAGEGLAGYLQQPAVLIAFAVLLAVLSLSMFDVYQLQVPSALQTRINGFSDRVGGGAVGGTAVLGALSALMVGPCVAAPLAGALLYIGQSRDVVLGGLALFALACGMSVPLLLAGASAGSLLPRAGVWMNRVKHVFGLLLLAVAWWMVSPLVVPRAVLAGWGLLAIAAAVFLGLCEPLATSAGPLQRALRVVVVALAVLGALELAGSAAGGDDALAPLARLAHAAPAAGTADGGSRVAEAAATPRFVRVASAVELDQALARADRPVMLDFYADWCVSCKEMERETFADPQVVQALAGFTLLRADVTTNAAPERELLKRFGLFGPPGLVFFDRVGHERSDARLVGFARASAFQAHLRRVAGG